MIYTLCGHEDIVTMELKSGYVLAFCANCHLSDSMPPLTASGPDELLPWWDHKPAAKEEIDACRPGVNRWQERRQYVREEIKLIRDLLQWEDEIGEPHDPALLRELCDLLTEQQRTGIQWPTSFSH